jgi:ubiquinone/menaquinone biosynthesis C-methylase UbiE
MAERLYDANAENVGLAAELDRLQAQARLSWRAECRRLAQLQIPSDASLLELGCGPGFVTELLHELLPNGTITALDHDAALLDQARTRIGANKAITFVRAEAAATGLPGASFDVVLSRYLFQHLSDPMPVAQEALRVLRPGGLHVIVDIDDGLWGVAEPSFPKLRAIHAQAAALQTVKGRDRHVGRHIWPILRRAGYVDLDLDVFCYHSCELGLDAFHPQLDPARLLPHLGDAGISMSSFVTAHALYNEFLAAPDAEVILLGFIGAGRRPR